MAEFFKKIDWNLIENQKIFEKQEADRLDKLIELDPESAMTKMRKITEKVVQFIYEKMQLSQGPSLTLERMAFELNKRDLFPADIYTAIGTVRAWGNLGAHKSGVASENDIKNLIPFFMKILDWFMEYLFEIQVFNIPSGDFTSRCEETIKKTQQSIAKTFDAKVMIENKALQNEFEIFLFQGPQSHAKVFALVGNTGMGKTWNTLQLGQRLLSNYEMCPFIFNAAQDFLAQLQSFFNTTDWTKIGFICKSISKKQKKPAFFLIDGLDAHPDIQIQQILKFLQFMIEKYGGAVLFLINCRWGEWNYNSGLQVKLHELQPYIYLPAVDSPNNIAHSMNVLEYGSFLLTPFTPTQTEQAILKRGLNLETIQQDSQLSKFCHYPYFLPLFQAYITENHLQQYPTPSLMENFFGLFSSPQGSAKTILGLFGFNDPAWLISVLMQWPKLSAVLDAKLIETMKNHPQMLYNLVSSGLMSFQHNYGIKQIAINPVYRDCVAELLDKTGFPKIQKHNIRKIARGSFKPLISNIENTYEPDNKYFTAQQGNLGWWILRLNVDLRDENAHSYPRMVKLLFKGKSRLPSDPSDCFQDIWFTFYTSDYGNETQLIGQEIQVQYGGADTIIEIPVPKGPRDDVVWVKIRTHEVVKDHELWIDYLKVVHLNPYFLD